MKISVCIATYNGSKTIEAQINSILKQIRTNDQIIIIDDASTDSTSEIIKSLNDSRIQLFVNVVNIGAVQSFNKALHLAQGDLIFLSDQDDIWMDNKITTILNEFINTNVDLIVHDAIIVKNDIIFNDSLFKYSKSSSGIFRNIFSNTYTGCCMSFRSNVLMKVLPIPQVNGIWHDAWIGIISECYGFKVNFLNIPLIKWHRHENNVSTTKSRDLHTIIKDRFYLIYHLISHLMRRKFN